MAGASGDCPAPRQLTPSPLCLPPPASHRDFDSSFCKQGSRPHRLWASRRRPLRGHRVQPPWLCQQPPRHGSERGGWACPQAGGQDGETASEMKGPVRPRGRRARGPGEAACRTVPPAVWREARGVPAVRVPPAAPAAWLRLPAYALDPERRRGQRQGAGHCHRHKARPRDVRTMPQGDAPRGRLVFLTAPCPRDVPAGSGPVTGTEARTLHGAEWPVHAHAPLPPLPPHSKLVPSPVTHGPLATGAAASQVLETCASSL